MRGLTFARAVFWIGLGGLLWIAIRAIFLPIHVAT
jgi:hypothetical protein